MTLKVQTEDTTLAHSAPPHWELDSLQQLLANIARHVYHYKIKQNLIKMSRNKSLGATAIEPIISVPKQPI